MTAHEFPEVDWAAAYARLAATDRALDEVDNPGEERLRELWISRARALAEPLAGPAPEFEATEQLVVFALAGERYGVDAAHVLSIQPVDELTPVPHTPGHIAGIMIVRGRVLTALDLRVLFDLPRRGLTESTRLLVVQSAGMEVGLLADEVLTVAGLASGALQPPLAHLSGVRADFLRGVTPDLVAVLDLEAMLGDQRLKVYDEP